MAGNVVKDAAKWLWDYTTPIGAGAKAAEKIKQNKLKDNIAGGSKKDFSKSKITDDEINNGVKYNDTNFVNYALGNVTTFDEYKRNIDAASSVSQLDDIIRSCISRITSRYGAEAVSQENGKLTVSKEASKTPEAKAIKYAQGKGLFNTSKYNKLGKQDREQHYEMNTAAGITTNGTQAYNDFVNMEVSGNATDVYKSLGEQLATAMYNEYIGRPEQAEAMIENLAGTVQRYKNDKQFSQYMLYYFCDSLINKIQTLPADKLTDDAKEDLAYARRYVNEQGSKTGMVDAIKDMGNDFSMHELNKSYRQAKKTGGTR